MSPRQKLSRSVSLLAAFAAALSLFSWDAVAGTRDVSEQVLHSFSGKKDGVLPFAGLAMDKKGSLYGATSGYYGRQGIIFKLTRKGKFTVLYSFSEGGVDSALLLDDTGNLYGTVPTDKEDRKGYVFKLSQDGVLTKLYEFGHGTYPFASVIADKKGNLYGSTAYGGRAGFSCGYRSGCGVIFKLTPNNEEQVLYAFAGGSDGGGPLGVLLRDGSGNLYGTTAVGGGYVCGHYSSGCGTVFKLSLKGLESVLYRFTGGADGGQPQGGLVGDKDGNLYGTTLYGGGGASCAYGCGVVFKVAPDGTETVLHAFAGGSTDGANPYDTLLLDKSGNLIGTTEAGGAYGEGTVFQIAPDGTETILYSFTGASANNPMRD